MATARSYLLAAAALLATPLSSARAADEGMTEFAAGRDAEAVAIWSRTASSEPAAQFGLGLAYDLGRGVAADPLAACDWYARAGDAGLAAAEFNRAVMEDTGRCGPRNPERAAQWYARAAARGYARAEYNMGLLYNAGDGVPHNARAARAWFAAAAADGLAAAAQASTPLPLPQVARLAPATPLWPIADTRAAFGPADIPLVWTSAEQPNAARWFVEVYRIDRETPALVNAAFVPRSATLLKLEPGAYAWRVMCSDATTQRYIVSNWATFQVALPR